MAIQEGRAERLSGLNRVTGIGSELGSWGRGDQRRPLRRLQIKFRHSTGTSTVPMQMPVPVPVLP